MDELFYLGQEVQHDVLGYGYIEQLTRPDKPSVIVKFEKKDTCHMRNNKCSEALRPCKEFCHIAVGPGDNSSREFYVSSLFNRFKTA